MCTCLYKHPRGTHTHSTLDKRTVRMVCMYLDRYLCMHSTADCGWIIDGVERIIRRYRQHMYVRMREDCVYGCVLGIRDMV